MAMDNARYAQVNGLADTEANYIMVDRIREAGRYLRRRTYRAFDRSAQGLDDKIRRNAAIDASHAFEAAQLPRRCIKAALCNGAQVNLARHNCWRLPVGRYTLHSVSNSQDWAGRPAWELTGRGGALAIYAPDLERELHEGSAALLNPADLGRDRQLVALKAASPMRPLTPQSDVDGLGLFDVVRQPSLAF